MSSGRHGRDPNRVVQADLAVSGEAIVAMGQALPAGHREIDARGRYVLPGGSIRIAISSSSPVAAS